MCVGLLLGLLHHHRGDDVDPCGGDGCAVACAYCDDLLAGCNVGYGGCYLLHDLPVRCDLHLGGCAGHRLYSDGVAGDLIDCPKDPAAGATSRLRCTVDGWLPAVGTISTGLRCA